VSESDGLLLVGVRSEVAIVEKKNVDARTILVKLARSLTLQA
jgi:hypothetical protein